MPPKHYITFVNGNIEITIGVYCSLKDLEQKGLRILFETVVNPLDYKIKTK
jgi:hypothetical protein